jgi:hypothetical protein
LTNGALLVKVGRLRSNLARNPSRKADFLNDVLSGCGVQFSNLSEVRSWKSLRKSHQCGPQTTVHIGDFSVNEPAHKHIGAIPDRAGDGEYFATASVCPPAAGDRSSGDGRGERRHRPGARLQH